MYRLNIMSGIRCSIKSVPVSWVVNGTGMRIKSNTNVEMAKQRNTSQKYERYPVFREWRYNKNIPIPPMRANTGVKTRPITTATCAGARTIREKNDCPFEIVGGGR